MNSKQGKMKGAYILEGLKVNVLFALQVNKPITATSLWAVIYGLVAVRAFYVTMFVCLMQLSVPFCFQELLVMLFLIIVVVPLPPKIRIMTAMAALTVLSAIKEPGGTGGVMIPTWTVCIFTDNSLQNGLTVSPGIAGKVITTPPRELRWKSDQWSFKNFLLFSRLLVNQRKSAKWLGD